MDDNAVAGRLAACERQIRSLRRALAIAGCLLIPYSVITLSGFARTGRGTRAPVVDSLRVRELTVIDNAGTVRTRIGGNLPDAVVDGHRVARGDNAAGVLLYDRAGRERSGYVTFDQSSVVGLTLDNARNQVALFAAGPETGSGATARLWREHDWTEMKVDQAGPHFSVGRNGAVVFMTPEMTAGDAAAMCMELKAEFARVRPVPPPSAVLEACKAHAPDGICRQCLGLP